jgi:predicted ester cyclase
MKFINYVCRYSEKPYSGCGVKKYLSGIIMDHTTRYKSIAEEYACRIWDKKDLSVIKDLVHPEAVIHSLYGYYHGPVAMEKVVGDWLNAFPDLVVHNKAVVCENEIVVIQWEAKGTHKGEFKNIMPTGRPVDYKGVTIYKIKENQISEYWAYLDMQHLLNQIM